jgi:hypothetical protein
LRESREKNEETGKQERVWGGIFLSYDKDESSSTISFDSMTEMTKSNIEDGKKCLYNSSLVSGQSGHSVTKEDLAKMMAYIQRKVSEYGNESDHAFNVIEALLEKSGAPIDEVEYCIKLYKQGHRVYIPRREA